MSVSVDYLILSNSSFYLKTLEKKTTKTEPYFLLPSLTDWSQCWRVYTFAFYIAARSLSVLTHIPLKVVEPRMELFRESCHC